MADRDNWLDRLRKRLTGANVQNEDRQQDSRTVYRQTGERMAAEGARPEINVNNQRFENVGRQQEGRIFNSRGGERNSANIERQQDSRMVDRQSGARNALEGARPEINVNNQRFENVGRQQEGRIFNSRGGERTGANIARQQDSRMVDRQSGARNALEGARPEINVNNQRFENVGRQQEGRIFNSRGGERNSANIDRQQDSRIGDRQNGARIALEGARPERNINQRRQRQGHGDKTAGHDAADVAHNNRQRRAQHGSNQRRQNTVNPEDEDVGPRNNKNRPMGFKKLEEISNMSSNDIIISIAAQRENFINLLKSSSDKPDIMVLILKIVSEISKSHLVNQKLNLLLEICNTPVLDSYLMRYLMDLPYSTSKSSNRYYWNNPDEFWFNFITSFNCLLTLTPSTVVKKYRSLIDAGTKCCLDGLKDRHNFVLSNNNDEMLKNLREQLTVKEEEEQKKPTRTTLVNYEEEPPPDNFRQLNVIPGKEELLIDVHPYVRANLVNGAYTDIEHYLDVQFRLLREDCFAPLRQGIRQYLESKNTKGFRKYDNIRVFNNVKFVEPYVSQNKVGSVIEISDKDKKRFEKIKWKLNKRYIFGSLLILTKDGFNSCITVTVVDRDEKYLSSGKIPVKIFGHAAMRNLYNDDMYTMIESEIYFEPYYHVLLALQDANFPKELSMQQYIVHADMTPRPPAYIGANTKFNSNSPPKYIFEVLSNDWPGADQLGYDDSQYEAYRLALTHEFVVIQGPPGTGKTFIGVEIAKSLLNNCKQNSGPLMLVICYTNHALDQFLEAVLKVTPSIVRIGGQSKNPAMEKLNIFNLRRQPHRNVKSSKLVYENRHDLKCKMKQLMTLTSNLQTIHDGIVSSRYLIEKNPEVKYIAKRYKGDDPVKLWLFSNVHDFIPHTSVNEEEAPEKEDEEVFEEDEVERNDVILDVFDDIETDSGYTGMTPLELSFSVKEVRSKIKHLKKRGSRNQSEVDDPVWYFQAHLRMYDEMMKTKYKSHKAIVIDERTDVTVIPIPQRWQLYLKWTRALESEIQNQIKPLTAEFESAQETYEEARTLVDLELLQRTKVIGMTTSGAARLRKLLQCLSVPIVIVEEAAEVLEQHIVTSLTKSCKHLILIGDHQQLRPSAACMQLARHFNIEISLFERMIMNDVHSRRLAVQHRMRPEIAALICPHIYKDLNNHPSVNNFPNVRGTTSNLFFMSHDYKEKNIDDSSSRSNPKEGDLVLGMANYIMQQDYEPEDVTILTAYAGQMFYLRQQRANYAFLSKVKITVVDNYQGEESKIILLSLVRNNMDGKIGFLGTENRICVALSRAKEGLYIFGNIHILKEQSKLWRNISATLEEKEMLGTIILQCENHSDQLSSISAPEDFRLVPEGGCLKKCSYKLPCHHDCPLICHAYDRNHKNVICKQKCERILCERGHVCPLRCATKCLPCAVLVDKQFKCGHTNKIKCYLDPNDPTVLCLQIVNVVLPSCEHKVDKACYLDVSKMKCPVPCPLRVSKCGHQCQRSCHVEDDPHHEQYRCQKACARARRGCTAELLEPRGNHQCQKRCYEPCEDCSVEVVKKRSNCTHTEPVKCNIDVNENPCNQNCKRVLECGHFCKRKCFQPCGGCEVKVVKKIPDCGHEIKVDCSISPTRDRCTEKCEQKLSCGHICQAPCFSPCDPQKCEQIVASSYKSPCGHNVNLPCNVYALRDNLKKEDLLQYCTEPCNFFLACDHVCSGTCSGCLQGRIHVACTEKCGQSNICSHQCTEPCKKMCPPCTQKCPVKCVHSACGNLCGEPCTPCKEPCSRSCGHGACERLCGEECSSEPCQYPCPMPLPCGHPCHGFCGDPCPPICRQCDPDNFPKDFLGDDFDEDARFIVLGDCQHILESEDMNNLMTGDQEEITIRSCPFCRAPIINTYRYKNIINDMIKTAINPIKLKVFGTAAQIKDKKATMDKGIKTFMADNYDILTGKSEVVEAFDRLRRVVLKQQKVSVMQLNMQEIYLNVLSNVAKVSKIKTHNKTAITELTNLICKTLKNNMQKISVQLQKDLGNEIKRMHAIVQLDKITSHASYLATKSNSKVKAAAQTASQLILGWEVFDERGAYESLEALEKEVKISGIVTREEVKEVVMAIGLKKGHWFRCPNGHLYCIGECGGAMEVATCNECGVSIGGTNHALLQSNSHAGDVDDSQAPAWSNIYNNMANFRL